MNKEKPLISVIIPTYNRLTHLKQSVESVICQEYKNIQLIIVNDGGESPESLLSKYQDRDIKLNYINLIKNNGVSAARNAGLKIAEGEWIALLDDDDYYKKNHISSLVELSKSSNSKFFYSLSEYSIGKENFAINATNPFADIEYNRDLLLISNYIPTPTWFFRKELVSQTGYFDTALKAWEDWEWLLRASQYTKFECTKKDTVVVNQRPDDASHLGLQHRPEMIDWFLKVYYRHPAPNEAIEKCRVDFIDNLKSKNIKSISNESNDVFEIIETASKKAGIEAIEIYTNWLDKPDRNIKYDCYIYYNLGCLYLSINDINEAKKFFSISSMINPKFTNSQNALNSLISF